LGLTDDEFYSLTPRQFHLLLEEHQHVVEHQEMLFGIVASTVANWSMHGVKKPLSHTDYMPSQWMKEKVITRTRKERQKPKILAAKIRVLFAGLVKE
jgi:hypothetical protein